MILLYENDLGVLEFGGRQLYLRSVSGLGMPKRENTVVTYANQPGQILVAERDAARVITLSCDVVRGDDVARELRRMLRVLQHPGRLTVSVGGMQRVIRCRCSEVDEPVRHGRDIRSVVLQLTCDNPYFTDRTPETETLFSHTDLIEDSFTLPCIFTERINRRIVSNQGDFRTEPVFTIYNAPNEAALLAEAVGVELLNHTTGQRLMLEYAIGAGETVTVDIPNRRIVSSTAGNIVAVLSADSYLSDFYLVPGPNDLEAVNYNTGENISVSLSYDNLYIEAVI
ncbi:MAG: phage tail family protein [Ruminococcaceae bacterium]|nr:phage tail family protein [Oscillospiraceae bacterium]